MRDICGAYQPVAFSPIASDCIQTTIAARQCDTNGCGHMEIGSLRDHTWHEQSETCKRPSAHFSNEGSCNCVAYLLQRFLHATLEWVPTIAGSAKFCLLYCQLMPFPESPPGRQPSLTRRCPCSLLVLSGHSISLVHILNPRHSSATLPHGAKRGVTLPK